MKTKRSLNFFYSKHTIPLYDTQNSFSPFLHFDSQTHKLQARRRRRRRRRRRIGVNPLLLFVVVVVPSAIVYFFL